MKPLYLLFVSLFCLGAAGCNPYNNAGEGAATGGALGALAGGIIGHQSHDTGAGMVIGGALGAVTGAAVGSQIEKPVPPPVPVVVSQAPASVVYSGNTVTVNVPNSDGTFTAVILQRSGTGFMGPQGEYYPQLPSTEQLRVMYSR